MAESLTPRNKIGFAMPRRSFGIRWRRNHIASIYRVAAVGVAATQIVMFPTHPHYLVSPFLLLISAAVYSGARILLPNERSRPALADAGLIAADMVFAATLVLLTGSIHSPFLMFALAPVVAVATKHSGKATIWVAGLTAGYLLASFLTHPDLTAEERLAATSDFFAYLLVLGLALALPYAPNLLLSQRLKSAARVDERDRLAREIHDGLCQLLYGAHLGTQAVCRSLSGGAEPGACALLERGDCHAACPKVDAIISEAVAKLGRLEALIMEAEGEARGCLESLRDCRSGPGLLSRVRDDLEGLEDAGVHCSVEAPAGLDLDELAEIELTRVCTEALTNVKKHSGARSLEVAFHRINGRVQVRIKDDGRGFRADDVARGHHGLSVMKERVESIGGRLQVSSAPGEGTEVLVVIPRKLPEDAL